MKFIQACYFLNRVCNLDCSFCKVCETPQKGLPFNEVKKILDTCKSIGFDIVVLFGGEPMLHPNIYGIVEYADRIKLPIAFSSNSLLINQKTAKKLVYRGLKSFTASIDSLNPEDVRSHAGLKAIKIMKDLCVPDVVANMIIHKDNLSDIPLLLETMQGLGVWSIFAIMQDCDKKDNYFWDYRSHSGLGLKYADTEQIKKVKTFILDKIDKGYKVHTVRSYFENMDTLGVTLNWKCSEASYIPIDWDGSIMSCPDFRGKRVGRNYSVHDLLNKEKRKQYLLDRQKDVKECMGCYYNHAWQVEHLDGFDLSHGYGE